VGVRVDPTDDALENTTATASVNTTAPASRPFPWELGEDDLKRLGWTDYYWTDIEPVLREEAESARMVRPAIPLFGQSNNPNAPEEFVSDYRIDIGPPLKIPERATLRTAELKFSFNLSSNQRGNVTGAQTLVRRAAHMMGRAEDGVAVLGNRAADFLNTLRVEVDDANLQAQTSSLIQEGQAAVTQPILSPILKAMENLQTRGYFGEYCAIVAPDLYRQAFEPQDRAADAPIYQIRELLSGGSFRYSPAVPQGRGVLLSYGGGTIQITVPRDVYIRWGEGTGLNLEVRERFRLLINDEAALEPLKDPNSE
jgi:uncharacterized linocin/CFP29 family protein